MGPLQLLVGGADLTTYSEQDGWSIAQQWSRQGDTASFTLTDEHPNPTVLSFAPTPLTTVSLTNTTTGQVLFSGVCPKPQVKILGPTLTKWQLDCVDWTYIADRTLVVGDYSGMTVDALAVLITTQANCGIHAATTADGGFVAPGVQIPRVQFNYDTLTAAWSRLSKLASASSTYGWYVDENRNLHFHSVVQATDSGWTLTDNPAQVNTTDTYAYLADTFAYEWDATSIRNSITVRGADYTQTQTDLWVGDGTTAAFPLTFLPDSQNIAAAALTVDGVTKTVSADTGSSAETDWVIVGNAANQWFLTPNTDPTPATVIIQFAYPYLQPVVVRMADATSIARFSGLPNRGVFDYYLADTSLPTLLAAQQRAQREAATYAQPTERVQIDVPAGFPGHFRAGQLVRVVTGMIPDSQRNSLAGIDDRFIVLQLRMDGVGGMYRTYQMTGARVGV